MSKKNDEFKEQYKQHPTRVKAISYFKQSNKYSVKKEVRQYMCQIMATIGLELESKFPGLVAFGDNQFKLFGREKSVNSVSTKRKLSIEEYDLEFKSALERQDNLPTEVRPIYDFYAYKLVCPEIKNPRLLINTVLSDILDNISETFPESIDTVSKKKEILDIAPFEAIDFIDNKFSDIYPNLKNKILAIMNEQDNVNKVQKFLDNTSSDVSSLTYSDYYSKIIECYQILIRLSYEESYEECESLAQKAKEAREQLSDYFEKNNADKKIDKNDCSEFSTRLQELLQHISNKKTNKLDLSLADLMIFDVLTTSKELERLGVKYSKDPTRTKKKRNPNGYIADFYSLDMPNGLTSEIQLQSYYRYLYGETGPAAHHKMENGIKKRILLPRPKEKSKYRQWAESQFKSLPKFFAYRGKGYVEVFNTLKNFRKYFKCKDENEVKTYIEFIASHDIDLLEGKLFSFSIGDESRLASNGLNHTDQR